MSTLTNSRSCSWSLFLEQYFRTRPEETDIVATAIQQPIDPQQIRHWLQEAGLADQQHLALEKDEFKRRLRRVRNRVFACLAIKDIDYQAPLEEVVHAISFLADTAVELTYQFSVAELSALYGVPRDRDGRPLEMIILGMGKLGGYELNVSSDIDLIMLYPHEGETDGAKSKSFHEFYSKVTQRMLGLLGDVTADGFVFRTDLRLRPDGDAGPLAWSLDALSKYLLKQGREWERYAWLKARPINARAFSDSSPDQYLQQLQDIRTPFVYRKYFDYHAPSSLRKLRQQISSQLSLKTASRDGAAAYDNIKLGPGGIREVEFIVQLQQLVHGGRMPSLQEANLLAALRLVTQAGLIEEEDCQELEGSYRLLRRIEHILQYRENGQTHSLPSDPERQAQLAEIFDSSWEEFSKTLQQHREKISELFNDAFSMIKGGDSDSTGKAEEEDAEPALQIEDLSAFLRANYDEETAQQLQNALNFFFKSSRIAALPDETRARLMKLLQLMFHAATEADFPSFVGLRMLDLFENVAQRSAYLAMLAEYPDAVKRVVRIMDASKWAATYLVTNPLLLQSLIDWEDLMSPINIFETCRQLERDLEAAMLADGRADVETQMNLMRDVQKQVSFKILAQDLENGLSVERLADLLSELADRLLDLSIKFVWRQLGERFDDLPAKPAFAVIAYGKLGGKELGYNSDLDLVFLFEDPTAQASDYYMRLARRLVSWFSTLTSSGRLYEIDMRLRPDGEAGMLAVSTDAFATYQFKDAWLWEHQAITRARFCAGDHKIGARFEQIRREVLLQKRDTEELQEGIIGMRRKMREGHRNKTRLFDLKQDPGGLVDVEFITQYLILVHARTSPVLLDNLGNIALLRIAAEEDIIDMEDAIAVGNAYRQLRRMQHILGLQGFEHPRLEPAKMQAERESVIMLWNWIFPKDPQHIDTEPKSGTD